MASVEEHLERGQHVVLSGPAGLGKTRLAAEIAALLRESRVNVHRVVASPASSPVPLAPFAALIGGQADDAVGAVVRNLGADGRSGPGDPVLLVDDLHMLDDASATLVQQLLLTGHVRLLGTLRTSAELPPAVGRLRHEADVVTIDVAPLPDQDIVAMVEQALGGVLDGRSHQLLTTASAGNPMYARELVEGSIEAGALSAHAGVWTFDGEMSATPLLEEVVLARLAPLQGAEVEALELLAVGGPLPYRLVEHVVGFEPLERLERMSVISASAPGASHTLQLDVAHPLYRELTRARLGVLARLRISRTLALADLAVRGDEPADESELLRSAVWHVRGGVELGPDALIAAARRAVASGDSPLGAERAEVAYRHHGGAAAALLASWCLAESGRHDDAIALLRDAATRATDPWEQAAMHLRVAEELWWTGRVAAARHALQDAPLPDGPWTALLDAQRGVFAVLDGELPDAWRLCRPLINHPHLWVRFVAAIAIGNAGIWGDETDEALSVCGAAVTAVANADISLLGDANLHLAIQLVAMLHSGDVDAAAQFAELGYTQAVRQPSTQVRAWAAMLTGQALAMNGQLARSCRFLAEAERGWAAVGLQGFASWCAAGLARAHAELGAADEAADTVRRMDGYQVAGFGLNRALLDAARAWLAAARGNRGDAATMLLDSLERCRQQEQHTHVAELWHEAARLDLLDLLPGLDEWQRPRARLAQARFDFVHARATGGSAEMEAAGCAFEELGALLYAAEAFAAAAAAARKVGAAKDAVRLDGRTGQLLTRCGGANTPLLTGRNRNGPLSEREREIARLATDGLSNRQIAERLVVSERTVENHLYRIFIKLGLSGRDQLGGALSGQ